MYHRQQFVLSSLKFRKTDVVTTNQGIVPFQPSEVFYSTSLRYKFVELCAFVLDEKKTFLLLIDTQTNVQTSRAERRQIILFEGLLAICGLSKAVPKNQMFIVYLAMDSNHRKLS